MAIRRQGRQAPEAAGAATKSTRVARSRSMPDPEGGQRKEEDGAQTEVESVRVTAPYAVVSVGGGATVNVGNYQSVRVDVSIEHPCPMGDAEVERCYDYCSAWVEDKIQRELDIATGENQNQERDSDDRPANTE